MVRSVFTFAADGTGTHIYQIFGSTIYGEVTEISADGIARFTISTEGGMTLSFGAEIPGAEVGSLLPYGTDNQDSATLEGARNKTWDWVPAGLSMEPTPFTWEFDGDSVRLYFSDYEETLLIELAEIEFVLLQEPDITLYKQ